MENIIEKLKVKFPSVTFEQDAAGAIFVPSDRIIDICSFLHNLDVPFDYLTSLTAVDFPPDKIVVVYHLCSLETNETRVLKTNLPREAPTINSITALYRAADWHEREVYDLFGVIFTRHPDLRRILTPEDCKGYPLRKDYKDARIIAKPKQEVKTIT